MGSGYNTTSDLAGLPDYCVGKEVMPVDRVSTLGISH